MQSTLTSFHFHQCYKGTYNFLSDPRVLWLPQTLQEWRPHCPGKNKVGNCTLKEWKGLEGREMKLKVFSTLFLCFTNSSCRLSGLVVVMLTFHAPFFRKSLSLMTALQLTHEELSRSEELKCSPGSGREAFLYLMMVFAWTSRPLLVYFTSIRYLPVRGIFNNTWRVLW